MIGGGLLIDSTVVSTAGYRAFVPFVLITPNHELWIKTRQTTRVVHAGSNASMLIAYCNSS